MSENDDLKILDEPFAEEEYAICVDKSNSELKDKINQALTDLKADGTLDEIIGHWIGDSADQKSYESAADATTPTEPWLWLRMRNSRPMSHWTERM